uniref:helix-turn-helix transcriptional regulator n=1 Tax=Eubacterium sp. TaxID=142586 RepID=UPI00402704E6
CETRAIPLFIVKVNTLRKIRVGDYVIRNKWSISEKYKFTSIAVLQENLPSLRAKADISQEELANIIGISRQTYSAIEVGKRTMSWSSYLSLVFFFHEIKSTKDMIDGLNIFPSDLFIKFNG